jgi:hypothetical protein
MLARFGAVAFAADAGSRTGNRFVRVTRTAFLAPGGEGEHLLPPVTWNNCD